MLYQERAAIQIVSGPMGVSLMGASFPHEDVAIGFCLLRFILIFLCVIVGALVLIGGAWFILDVSTQ